MTLRRHNSVNPETEQSERMERWFVRLAALNKQGVDEDTFVEFALVVLQQCDAMRDWLTNATTIKAMRDSEKPGRSYKRLELPPIPVDDIARLFETDELQACRAIVNGAKHLHLDRKHVDLKAVSTVPSPWDQRAAGKPFDMRPLFVVSGQNLDAFDLCRDCVMRIRGFLVAHGWPRLLNRMVRDVSPLLVPVPNPEGTLWQGATTHPGSDTMRK
jgi:hypothetical protein